MVHGIIFASFHCRARREAPTRTKGKTMHIRKHVCAPPAIGAARTAALALAAAIGAALAPHAGATTSEPMLILANGNESLLWHTVGAGSTTLYWDKPASATSATLTIEGYRYSRTYANLTGDSCEISLPPVMGAGSENAYSFTLAFDDGTTQTAYIGDVVGVGSTSATAGRVKLESADNWDKFHDRAVIPIPFGATSLTVNGTPVDGIDGSAGWRYLGYGGNGAMGGSSLNYALAMTVTGQAAPLTANIEGLPSMTVISFR